MGVVLFVSPHWSSPVLSCVPNTQAVGEAQQRLVLVQALLGLFTRAQHHISLVYDDSV